MEEKVSKAIADSQVKKERFSFELRINDNIVCQRYFRINGFNRTSLSSTQLADTLRYCAQLIKDDLKDKTQVFNYLTAPMVFDDEEEMLAHENNRFDSLYAVLRNQETNFVRNGSGEYVPYEKFINKVDYIGEQETTPCQLKLSFLDSGVEVCSTVWDGNIYPRFIRTNIDLSNSKNKYKAEGVFAPFESAVVTMLNENREDLIPIIVKEFCICCSYKDNSDYTTNDYGYDYRVSDKWNRYVSYLERKYQKKTEKYFASIGD